MLIRRADALLLVVDLQERLAPAITGSAAVVANTCRLLAGARRLGVPAWVSEQYVRGLGATLPAVRDAAVDAKFFEKNHFSCAAEPGITDQLRATGRSQIVLAGTEAHVCVLQTALGLQAAGFSVFVVADAVGARVPASREAALNRLQSAAVGIVTTEMVLFEWLQRAATDEFRDLLPLIK